MRIHNAKILIVSACLFVIALSINVSKKEGFQATKVAGITGVPYKHVTSTNGSNIVLDGGIIYNTNTGSLSNLPNSPYLCPSDQKAVAATAGDARRLQNIPIKIGFNYIPSTSCTYVPIGPYTATAIYNAFNGRLSLPRSSSNYPTLSCPGRSVTNQPPLDPILFDPELICSTSTISAPSVAAAPVTAIPWYETATYILFGIVVLGLIGIFYENNRYGRK